MKIPVLSKLNTAQKDIFTLISGFCGVMVLHMCLLSVLGWYKFHIGYLLTVILLISAFAFPLGFSKKIKENPAIYRALMYVFNTLIMYFYTETVTRYLAPDRIFSWQFPLGIAITLCIYALISAISGSYKITLIATNFIMMAVCVSNRVILDLRGRPLFISDFTSLTTAMNVSSSYDVPIIKYIIIFIGFLLITLFCLKLPQMVGADIEKSPLSDRVVWGIYVALILFMSYGTNLYKNLDIELTYWSHKNGILLDWVIESRDFRVKMPENYSVESIEAVAQTHKPSEDIVTENTIKPNIIVIMNESFSDLSVVAPFNTDIDYMPFLRSVKAGEHKDMIAGDLYASVYGGNTANSEYEFLTGDSIVLYPQNSVPYQTFLDGKGEISGLTSQLKKMGYSTTAMHPYWASGWNRTNIYSYMGFDNQYYLDNMTNIDYIRQYCSDSCDYRKLINLYENRDREKPFYIFNVTMQNHGGYTDKSYTSTVHLTDYPGQFPQTEQYLSLIRESDRALRELINYFRRVKEPTVIIFFGDHQPSVETGFYEALYGKSFNSLTEEESLKMYITQYMVWKNFETPEFEIGDISINYLAARVLEMIGMPTTSYQNYLLDMREKTYPIITASGVVDTEGNFIPAENADLAFYKTIVYNHMIDNESYKKQFFEHDYEIDTSYLEENYGN